MNTFLPSLRRCASLLGFLAAVAASATPSIQWNTNLPNRQQNGFGIWYPGAQAIGYNCNIVKVWVTTYINGTGTESAFSFKGISSGNGTIVSDQNWAQTPASAGVQVYRAQAVDDANNASPEVYWIVKTFAAGTATAPLADKFNRENYTIGYDDLPIQPNGAKLFPNLGSATANTRLMNDVVLSLSQDSRSGKIVEFKGTTLFDLGSAGQLWGFKQVSHLVFRSSSAGTATLQWSASGGGDPHSLWGFDHDCSSITIDSLAFDTGHNHRSVDGTHLKISGHDMTISNSYFYHAPGFTISIGADQAGYVPHDIAINYCTLTDNYSDGIHVYSGNAIQVSHNTINGTGDDGIAILNDGLLDSTNANYHVMSTGIHLLSNTVTNTGWRGIVVQTARDSEITSNTVDTTALHTVEISKFDGLPTANRDGNDLSNPDLPYYPRRITITGNNFFHAGWHPAHPSQNGYPQLGSDGNPLADCDKYYHGAHGLYLFYFNNPTPGETTQTLVCSGNGIRYHSAHCVYTNQTQNLQIGNSSWINSAGQPLTLGGSQQWADNWFYNAQSFALYGINLTPIAY